MRGGLTRASLAFLVIVMVVLGGATMRASGSPVVRGTVVDMSGLPLPGAAVTLTRDGAAPLVLLTDLDGRYAVNVPPGAYVLVVEVDGFDKESVDVTLAEGGAAVRDVALRPAGISASVEVTAAEPAMIGEKPSQPPAVGRKEIEAAPVPNNKVEDVLPLLPGVVRGPDGRISVAGARAPQGALLVNGLSEVDPVTGEFGVTVPLAAVQKVEVVTASDDVTDGNAVSGITRVETRPGGDKFLFTINSVDPRPHIVRGWIESFDGWSPNGGIRGPIVRGRAWFAQSIDYRYERTWFDTRIGRQPTKQRSLSSLTQIDVRVADANVLSGYLSFYPQSFDHAALNAFTPAASTPHLDSGGWSAALIDRASLRKGLLESRFQAKTVDLTLTPDNDNPYLVAHDLIQGGYFNSVDRKARRYSFEGVYTRSVHSRVGDHQIVAGASAAYASFDGQNASRPVDYLRSDGTLARTITFVGSAALAASSHHLAAFVQDGVSLSNSQHLDVGVRVDAHSAAGSPRVSPRAGWSYALPDGRTTVSAHAGLYADKLVLGAFAFPQTQDRLLTIWDATGTTPIASTPYRNVLEPLRIPQAGAWSLQVDRQFSRGWVARLRYYERHGHGEQVISPVTLSPAEGQMVLASTGRSRTRSIETTVGRRLRSSGKFGGSEIYVSYVRSTTRGNLNDLNSVQGNFLQPLVQPDEVGPLSADVPHRLLAWAVFNLPWQVTVAPFFEVRNGFPFSALNDEWVDVGPRNSMRLPVFASLDFVAQKVFQLPLGLPKARAGVKLFNVTGRFNGHDIQADLSRPDFGTTYNPGRRTVRGIFEVVWAPGGRKEHNKP